MARFGQYEILERVGRSFVYKAMDERRGKLVALKVLPAWMQADRATMVRFEREVAVERVVEHRNLVTLYTVGKARVDDPDLVGSVYDEDGMAEISFLVMDYVEGEDLEVKLERGPLPLREALGIGVQIAQGLAAVHAVGVAHRNLNPGNVRITPQGQVKLLDFRLAKLIEREGSQSRDADRFQTDTGEVLGTVPYLAPEQFQGQGADRRSDLFALGVLLYQMTSGQLPFPETDLLVYFRALEKEDPKPLSEIVPDVPEGLEGILTNLLAKDPGQRYRSARRVATDLAALLKPPQTT